MSMICNSRVPVDLLLRGRDTSNLSKTSIRNEIVPFPDVDQRRQDQQVRPRSAGVAKSADYVPHRNREDQGAPRARPRSATAGEKVSYCNLVLCV